MLTKTVVELLLCGIIIVEAIIAFKDQRRDDGLEEAYPETFEVWSASVL